MASRIAIVGGNGGPHDQGRTCSNCRLPGLPLALSVFLACDQRVAIERGIARDASWMENARERYETRYVPEEARHLAEVDPASLADVVIDTT